MIEVLQIFAEVLFPVFGIAAIGFGVARRWKVGHEAPSALAYRILTPAFIFRLLSDPAAVSGRIGAMLAASLGTVLVVWAFMMVAGRRAAPEQRALDAMLATFGNVGNLGFPIVLFGLGEEALAPAGIHFLAVTVGAFVLAVVMAARVRSASAAGAVRQVVLTPAIMAAPLALVVAGTDWQVPEALGRMIGLLADAMIPVMLLTLGMQLARARMTLDAVRLLRVAAAKLLVAPVVFLLFAAALGLTGLARDSGLLLAAMPSAVLVSLVALEYDLEPEVAGAGILLTSLAAIPTLAVVLSLLG